MNTDTIAKAIAFLNIKLSHMSASDRIAASREAKEHILKIIEIYKKTKEPALMRLMKSITILKLKIEKPLNKEIKEI